MKRDLLIALTVVILLLLPKLNFSQAPDLGTASSFALFTSAGAFNVVSGTSTVVTGDVGTNVGAFNGFPPGVLIGEIHVADAVSAIAGPDVMDAYAELSTVACDQTISVTLGNGQMLLPGVYCTGGATTINGDLILDGQGDPNSIFIFKFGGALATTVDSRIILTGGASLCNIYFQVDGQVDLGENSLFNGTLLVNGAINLLDGATLNGRALSRAGAISLRNNVVNGAAPVASEITANGDATTFCLGDSVILTGNLGGIWNTGATTPSITVTTSGIYFVTNTTNCGSINSDTITVTVNPLPICSITGNPSFCPGGSTEICASDGASSYLWSTGETTQCITINTAGTYTVTITDANGCSSSCSQGVIQSNPICSITGNPSICEGGTTELCATEGAASYLWSTGADTRCITVDAEGTYTVTITDANGCISTCSQEVIQTDNPMCIITGNPSLCVGGSTELCVPPGADSYLWSTGATTNCITVLTAGIYSVTTTDGGCVRTCTIEVTENPSPACLITGDTILCLGDSIQLCALSGAASYMWSTGQDTECIFISIDGTYSVTITDENGCTSMCSHQVTLNDSIPNQLSVVAVINLSLDSNCMAIVDLTTVLTGEFDCLSEYTLTLIYPPGTTVYNPPIKVDATHIGEDIKFIVTLPNGNSTWGIINVEDKQPLDVFIPIDTCISCLESILPERTGDVIAEDCLGPVMSQYRDVVVDYKCTPENDTVQIITRTWTIINNSGQIVTGVQLIYVKAVPSDSIRGPIAFVELSCEDSILPESIRLKLGVAFAYPYYVSPLIPDFVAIERGSSCHFVADYADIPIFEEVCQPNCKATQKILRTWTVLNWCDGEVRTYQQLIKRLDNTAPEITVPNPNQEYSVNAWGCDVDITLPAGSVIDNCDPDAAVVQVEGPFGVTVVRVNGRWIARGVPNGIHTFTYTASDCCGNLSTAEIRVIVKDRVAPVATAKEFITLSLTQSGDDSIPGVAKLFTSQVDNGSYDNCTEVYMEVRRDDDAPACLNEGDLWNHDNNGSTPDVAWNNNRTYNSRLNGLDQTTDLHLQDNALDTDKGQYVKFCCEDIGEEVKVWLRVWDDANGSGIFGDTIEGMGDNYNETWTMVKVEDKIVPRIECVPYVETSCDRDTGIVTDYNFQNGRTASQIVWENTIGKVPSSLVPTAEGVCNDYEFEFYDIGSLSVCNTGTFIRTYRVIGHPTVSCTQTIYVGDQYADPQLEWPMALHNWNSCELTEEDVLNFTVRARINVGREKLFIFKDLSCLDEQFFSELSWKTDEKSVLGEFGPLCPEVESGSSLTENANLFYNTIPSQGLCGSYLGGRPEPISTLPGDPKGLEGRPRFNPNIKDPGCNVFGRKITIEEYTVGEGCKKWLVRWDYINWCCNGRIASRETIYKYEDTVAPEIVECPGVDTDILDANCRAQFTLSPEATDEGLCDAGLSWRIRIYPNIANPTAEQINNPSLYTEYRTVNGLITGLELRGTNPTFTHPTGLLAGIHGVLYIVRDGCGNVTECRSTIGIWPKAPTPYCVSLSSAVMKNGLVELWAEDFDRGSFQNCPSPAGFRVINDSVRIENDVLFFTFNRAGQAEHPIVSRLHQEHYFRGLGEAVPGTLAQQEAAYNEGKAQKWLPTVERGTRPLLPDGSVNPVSRWDWVITGGTSGQQFGCNAGNTIGVPIIVEMRVWDVRLLVPGTAEGSDFCSTRLTLIDNQGGCGEGTLVVLGGTIQTEAIEMMGGVDVTLKAELPEYPHTTKTDKDGKYEFATLPIGVDYTIEANKKVTI
jgi:hypothetical protein